MTKECWNLIGEEAHLAKSTQKQWSQVLPSLDDYYHVKKLRYQLIL